MILEPLAPAIPGSPKLISSEDMLSRIKTYNLITPEEPVLGGTLTSSQEELVPPVAGEEEEKTENEGPVLGNSLGGLVPLKTNNLKDNSNMDISLLRKKTNCASRI